MHHPVFPPLRQSLDVAPQHGIGSTGVGFLLSAKGDGANYRKWMKNVIDLSRLYATGAELPYHLPLGETILVCTRMERA